MGCSNSKPVVHAYYDPDGSLVTFEHPKKHSPKRELVCVSTHDAKKFRAQDFCYVVSSAWHAYWIDFATRQSKQIPPEVDNNCLLDGDQHIRRDLKHRKHFRAISRPVWEYYFKLYGGGPVIYFRVPGGYSADEYEQSTWIKKVKLHEIGVIIFPSSFPSPNSDLAMVSNPMAQANASLAVGLMQSDLSKAKFQQAKEVQKEINAANAEAIGAMMAKDMGKRKLEEAREKDKEQNQAQVGAVGHMFAGELAQQTLRKAQQAKAEEQVAQSENVALLFQGGSVKKNFREALARKDNRAARHYAATMLKNAWRSKLARRKALQHRAEKQRLLQEGMARKLQAKYRTRLARRKVERLRAEKQRLREEGAAIIVQSNWRIRKARQRAAKLKQEKQRLLEEGAALKVQSRWRVRRAQARTRNLRNERQAQEARRGNAQLRVLRFLLVWRAKFILLKKRKQQPQMVQVRVKRARDINIGDVTSSDPYVLVHCESKHLLTEQTVEGGLHRNASALSLMKGSASALGEDHPPLGSTRSKCKTTAKSATLAPDWEETTLAVYVHGDDKIVLTMLDKDNFHKDKFLGQVVIEVRQHPELYSGKVVEKRNVKIDGFKVPVHDIEGRPQPLPMSEVPGKGTMDFSITMLPSSRNFCGWVMKMASSLISFSAPTFKPRFLVLCNGVLNYYDNEHSLDHSRDSIPCREVTRISYGPDNKSGHLTLVITGSNGAEWFFHWIDNERDEVISRWLRVLDANCPQAPINGDERSRSVMKSTGTGRTDSVSSAVSSTANPIALKTSKSAALRRGSSMFAGAK